MTKFLGNLPLNCRAWDYYPIEMPLTENDEGPATVGLDAKKITYEVWDWNYTSHATFDNLPDAINEAIRLTLEVRER